jgi:hypothetical protein
MGDAVATRTKRAEEDRPVPYLTPIIIGVVTMLLAFASVLLSYSLFLQKENYAAAVRAAMTQAPPEYAIIMLYSRAWDTSVLRTTSIFFGYIVLFVGALYVLRSADSIYKLGVEGKPLKGSLESSSPGLVMITLAVVLISIVLFQIGTPFSYEDFRPGVQAPTQVRPEPPFIPKPPITRK